MLAQEDFCESHCNNSAGMKSLFCKNCVNTDIYFNTCIYSSSITHD